jgi:hypothetical protein
MRLSPSVLLSLILLTSCSSKGRESRTFPAGEKAIVDHMTYSIIDSEIHTRLGDESNPRIPHDRFFLIQVAVSNGGNEEAPIPSLTLVDDSGQTYNELSDGTGVQRWLGVVRKVAPGQTERGYVAFDAPAAHYKLKLSDDASDSDVYADIPLSFVHETQSSDAAGTALPAEEPPTMKKK